MSAWVLLFVAGLLEAGWAVGLKYTDGFTRPLPSVLTLAGTASSLWMLSLAARTLPIGIAYAVWVGIGATGAAFLSHLFLDEPLTPLRLLSLALLIAGIVGLRLTAN